ncbi:hypothetical protein L4D13_01080 [Photobacterium profundum]|uniref:tetratricopeptide repeat protein n=1 Tax=Photobacterium profundum TaxID=74109 RepID=UPI003D132AAD
MTTTVITFACQEVGIPHSEFQSGLSETYFATETDYGNDYGIELVSLAKSFFANKFSRELDSEKILLRGIVEKIEANAVSREKINREYKQDRVAEAFRSDYAKAAKTHADRNEISEAIEMYELAIEEEAVNAALHDRFAWLLLNKTKKFEYAENISQKAVLLDPSNCDAIVDLALIYYRQGKLSEGDKQIDQARIKGRPLAFCLLRKAISRFHEANESADIETKVNALEFSLDHLEKARRSNNRSDSYYQKNRYDIDKHLVMVKRELTKQRAAITRSKSNS